MILKQRAGQEHVDIITFYNEIFIPSAKALLVELGPGGSTTKINQIPEANINSDGTFFVSLVILYYIPGFPCYSGPAIH